MGRGITSYVVLCYGLKGQKKSKNIISHLELGRFIGILQFQWKRRNLSSK